MEAETPQESVLGSEDSAVLPNRKGDIAYSAVGRGDKLVVETILVRITLHKAGESVCDSEGMESVTAYSPANLIAI